MFRPKIVRQTDKQKRKAAEKERNRLERRDKRKARYLYAAPLSSRAELDQRNRQQLAMPRRPKRSDSAQTAFQRARAALHVSATPEFLPCRADQYADIESYLEDAIVEGRGSCICACCSLC
jgi:hypothetical protein